MATKINKAWHQQNKMPKNPTPEQKVKWHLEHLEHCACRKPTAALQKLIDEYKRN